MTEKTTTKEYTLDATGQKLGRLATKVALLLRGKTQASFERHIMPDVKVTITNASKIDLSAKKMGEEYKRFTGYPGGLKTETRGHLIGRKGYKDVFTNTVYGMLPGNRLRKQIMKNLIINE
jgi:large subunit ribosomal protein L13